jgi:hypothetical protein
MSFLGCFGPASLVVRLHIVARFVIKSFCWLLIAVAAWQLAPGAVQASCGDYVMMGGHAGMPAGNRSAVEPQADLPAIPKLPCHGPSCGNGPVLPLTSPTVVVVESETQRPLLSLAGDYRLDECWTFGESPQRLLAMPEPMKEIEHPPQLA